MRTFRLILGYLAVAALARPALLHAQIPGTTTLTWNAPTTFTDGTPITGAITYNVYAGGITGALTKVVSNLTGTSNAVVNATQPCYAVSAVVAGVESALSPSACVKIPGSPGTVVVVVTPAK